MTTLKMWRWLRRRPRLPLYASCFFFAVMALLVKILTGTEHGLPAIEVVFFRSFLCLLLLLPGLARGGFLQRGGLAGISGRALFMRSLAGGLAMICYFHAIQRLSLADAVLLNYTSPLWASLFAYGLLQESLSPAVMLAYPIALLGVMMVVGAPGHAEDLNGYLIALASAVLAGGAYTALRGLRQTPPLLVVGGLCATTSFLAGPYAWKYFQAPTPGEWTLLWMCAGASALAQLFMTIGYRWSSTASASTVGMATVGMSGCLSWLVLGEALSGPQLLGILVLLTATSQASRPTLFPRLLASLRPLKILTSNSH